MFVGYDVAEEAIKGATADSKTLNNFNTLFEVQNLLTIEPTKKFDFITAFDVIHDQINPSRTLKFIFDSLNSRIVFLTQDILSSTDLAKNINHPLGPFFIHVYLVCIACQVLFRRMVLAWVPCGEGKRRWKCYEMQGS